MADEGHGSAGLMRRFLSDEATRKEAQQVLAHLLQGCQPCGESAHQLLSQGVGGWYSKPGEPATVEQLEGVFDRVFEAGEAELRRLAVEKLQGEAQWAALDPLVPEERMARVLSDPGLWTRGLHQRLIEASRWHGMTDPAEGIDIVRLALVVAERIAPARLGGEAAREDVIAETLALLGSAQRFASDFEGACKSFNEAWSHQDQGTGDPLTRALITRLEASWMIDLDCLRGAQAGPLGQRRQGR
jgi:hypothetical protein